MTVHITLPTALELLREAVEDRGSHYVDEGFNLGSGCSYVMHPDNGERKPGCIVGYVLHAAGVPLDTLEQMDHKGSLACMGKDFIAQTYDIELDADAYTVLRRAQTAQDEGNPWGQALERALKTSEADQLAGA